MAIATCKLSDLTAWARNGCYILLSISFQWAAPCLAQSEAEVAAARKIDANMTKCILADNSMNAQEKTFWILSLEKVKADGNLENLRSICTASVEKEIEKRKVASKRVGALFELCSRGKEWVMGLAINPETGAAVFTWDRPSRPGEDKLMAWFYLADILPDGIDLQKFDDERRLYLRTTADGAFRVHWIHWTPQGIKDDWFAETQQMMVMCKDYIADDLFTLLDFLRVSSPPREPR